MFVDISRNRHRGVFVIFQNKIAFQRIFILDLCIGNRPSIISSVLCILEIVDDNCRNQKFYKFEACLALSVITPVSLCEYECQDEKERSTIEKIMQEASHCL